MKENFKTLRKIMLDNQVRPVGVTSLSLLESLGEIKREKFVPENKIALSYSDMDIKLNSDNRYLMASASFAKLAQLADVKKDDIVLVVGCGSGYSVAVLSLLANAVVGIEQDEKLAEKANETLSNLNIGNGVVLNKDITKGVPSEAPFDVILLEGEVDEVPATLFRQLRDGARLVAVIAGDNIGKASIFVKSKNDISSRVAFDVKVPRLPILKKEAPFIL